MRLKSGKREEPVPGAGKDWTTSWSSMDYMDCLDTEVPNSEQRTRQQSGCCSTSQRDKYVQHLKQNGIKDPRVSDLGCSCDDSEAATFAGVSGSSDIADERSYAFEANGRESCLDDFVFAEEVLGKCWRTDAKGNRVTDSSPSSEAYSFCQNSDVWDDRCFSEKCPSAGGSHSSGSSPSHTNCSVGEDESDKSKAGFCSASNPSLGSTESRKKHPRAQPSHNARKENRTRYLPKDKATPSASNPASVSPPQPDEEKEGTWGDVLDWYYAHFFVTGGKASGGFRLPVPPRRIPRRRRRNEGDNSSELLWPNATVFFHNLLTITMMIGVWMWSLTCDAAGILWRIFQVLLGLATLAIAVLYVWIAEAVRIVRQRWRKWRGKDVPEQPAKQSAPIQNNITLPATGDEAVSRLLTCQNKDPYSILGVSRKASDEDIKKYYRRQAVLVHPDKNPTKGAEEAFKILAHAFDLIGEPEKRLQYDNASMESEHMEAAWRDFEDLLSKLHAKMEEAANTIQCTNCGKRHHRIPTERPCYSARYCSTCKTHHAARNGDIWAESTYLGFKWHYYACMDSAIFDVTEWAACQSTMLKHLQSNSHNVQYRIISNKKPKPSKPNLPSEPEMEEFINFFCGTGAGAGSPPPPPPSDNTGSFKSNLKKKNKKKKR